jgi:4-alpha-glucanotransferase
VSDRHVGINVPLFSLRSERGWGLGELTDLAPFVRWLSSARIDRVLLLPLGTMQHGQTSPYSATSTLAIDPIYINLERVADFDRAGGMQALSSEGKAAIARARQSRTVDYGAVRAAKAEALALAFARFVLDEWELGTDRARELALYIDVERWWLDDYALHQALSSLHDYAPWTQWEVPLRNRDARTLDGVRERLARPILAQQYMQWVAEHQWQQAHDASREAGVAIYGDLPFVAGTDSPEIWAQAHDFMLEVSTGVPPDAFSPTGQDWGLPTYRWEAIRAGDYRWLRHRSRRMAALFDGLRVDHTIGLYRTYGRPRTGAPFFTPGDTETQIAQGSAILRILAESGLDLIAEDLGVVPDFLHRSLEELGVPGCKVLRWERDYHAPGAPFVDPATFPERSAAMTGTHDTEPNTVWWRDLPVEDRRRLLDLPVVRRRGVGDASRDWSDELRDALLELSYSAGSRHLFLPLQDVFGWEDRINLPGTVGPDNWTWVLPWPADRLAEHPQAVGQAALLSRLALAYGRGGLH